MFSSYKYMVMFSLLLFCILGSHYVLCVSKYSEEMNVPKREENLKYLEKPFRMQKLNIIWEKAQKSLSDKKLKTFYSEMKVQDKEELNLKRLRADGMDKDGLKEAIVNKQLNMILKKYGLSEHFQSQVEDNNIISENFDPSNEYFKEVFKDKRLNKLWMKAQKSGLSGLELKALREEFHHHQEKLDQYYHLMDYINDAPKKSGDDIENTIDTMLGKEEEAKQIPNKYKENPHQLLKEKHRDIKTSYETLENRIVSEMEKKEYDEPRVQMLWDMAQNAGFTSEELSSLKQELHHYEHRLKKLRHLETTDDISEELYKNKYAGEKSENQSYKKKQVKELSYKVEKLHKEIERRISQHHLEL